MKRAATIWVTHLKIRGLPYCSLEFDLPGKVGPPAPCPRCTDQLEQNPGFPPDGPGSMPALTAKISLAPTDTSLRPLSHWVGSSERPGRLTLELTVERRRQDQPGRRAARARVAFFPGHRGRGCCGSAPKGQPWKRAQLRQTGLRGCGARGPAPGCRARPRPGAPPCLCGRWARPRRNLGRQNERQRRRASRPDSLRRSAPAGSLLAAASSREGVGRAVRPVGRSRWERNSPRGPLEAARALGWRVGERGKAPQTPLAGDCG